MNAKNSNCTQIIKDRWVCCEQWAFIANVHQVHLLSVTCHMSIYCKYLKLSKTVLACDIPGLWMHASNSTCSQIIKECCGGCGECMSIYRTDEYTFYVTLKSMENNDASMLRKLDHIREDKFFFLLCNNLFIYQVLCTLIYRRCSLYSFLIKLFLSK